MSLGRSCPATGNVVWPCFDHFENPTRDLRNPCFAKETCTLMRLPSWMITFHSEHDDGGVWFSVNDRAVILVSCWCRSENMRWQNNTVNARKTKTGDPTLLAAACRWDRSYPEQQAIDLHLWWRGRTIMMMRKDSHTHSLLRTWYIVAKSPPCHTRDTAMSLVGSSHWQRQQDTFSDCLKVLPSIGVKSVF